MKRILLINGPNLNMLGVREPGVYGTDTLETLEQQFCQYVTERGADCECYQSNHEGALIDKLHAASKTADGIVYNPGAHTHYSYALRDAVAAIAVPVVEVHISDVSQREAFRHVSVIAPECVAQVKGFGLEGYKKAVDILLEGGFYITTTDEDAGDNSSARTGVVCARLGDNYAEHVHVGAQVVVAKGNPMKGSS